MSRYQALIRALKKIRRSERGIFSSIAAFTLDNLDLLPCITLQEYAVRTFSSYATVSRFLREIHTDGFRDFKKILLEERTGKNEDELPTPDTVSEDSDIDEINEKICEFYGNVIRDCRTIISSEVAEKIATLFEKANLICFVGLGTSAISAQYANVKFFRINQSCVFDSDVIISKMRTSSMNENSVLFSVSSSGRTKSILNIAEAAKANGATVIALCDFAGSPLAKIADIALSTTVRESNKYIDVEFPMIQGQITMIDLLYANVFHLTHNTASARFQKTMDVIRPDKERSTVE